MCGFKRLVSSEASECQLIARGGYEKFYQNINKAKEESLLLMQKQSKRKLLKTASKPTETEKKRKMLET